MSYLDELRQAIDRGETDERLLYKVVAILLEQMADWREGAQGWRDQIQQWRDQQQQWRTNVVNPTLQNHENRLDALEDRVTALENQ